jgi:hypothetical protein
MYQTDWSLAALKLRLVEPDKLDVAAAAAAPVPGSSSSTVEKTGLLLDQLQDEAEARQQDAAGPSSGSSSSGSSSSRKASGLPQRSFNLPLASLEGRSGVPVGSKLWATFLPLELPSEDGRPPRGISSKLQQLTFILHVTLAQFLSRAKASGVLAALPPSHQQQQQQGLMGLMGLVAEGICWLAWGGGRRTALEVLLSAGGQARSHAGLQGTRWCCWCCCALQCWLVTLTP